MLPERGASPWPRARAATRPTVESMITARSTITYVSRPSWAAASRTAITTTAMKTVRRNTLAPRRSARPAWRATRSASHPALITPAIRITSATRARPERLMSWSMVFSSEGSPRTPRAPATPVSMMPQNRTVPIKIEGLPSYPSCARELEVPVLRKRLWSKRTTNRLRSNARTSATRSTTVAPRRRGTNVREPRRRPRRYAKRLRSRLFLWRSRLRPPAPRRARCPAWRALPASWRMTLRDACTRAARTRAPRLRGPPRFRARPRRRSRSSRAPPSVVRRKASSCSPSGLVTAVVPFGEGYQHGRAAPRDPTLGRSLRDFEDLCYLGVGEPFHVPEDQRGPVLGTHVAEGSLNLLALLRPEGGRFRVRIAAPWFWQVRHLLAAILPLLAARLLAPDAEASVDDDPV